MLSRLSIYRTPGAIFFPLSKKTGEGGGEEGLLILIL